MNRTGISVSLMVGNRAAWIGRATLFVGALTVGSVALAPAALAQAGPPPGQRREAPAAKAFPLTLTITDGTTANYRVREQLVGIKFPNDAVGRSTAVSGEIVFKADGSIDASKSKLEFDLRTLKSDQPMRDGFIQGRTLDTKQYPMAVFVPKTITDMPNPLTGQFGFELSGDMTIHGTTAPVTWQGMATVDHGSGLVAGRAETSFKFETFGMTVPKIFRVMSVADSIGLEMEFQTKIN